ncbi:MAG: hypothetical protein DSZ28_10045 [Thiothrix sp.]|nr:MAG: hypothetical protein DSZ28_10045 [Thiothrix sp.]
MKKINSVVAIATLFFASFSIQAQEDGQQMLTQDLNSGSGQKYALRVLSPDKDSTAIGGRMMLDDNMGVDIDLAFNFDTDTKTSNGETRTKGLGLGMQAGLINYMSKGRVAPYYKVGGGLNILTSDKGKGRDNDFYLLGGLGAEFFIIPEFSLFAEAGLEVSIAPDFAINTGSTQVGLAFYF